MSQNLDINQNIDIRDLSHIIETHSIYEIQKNIKLKFIKDNSLRALMQTLVECYKKMTESEKALAKELKVKDFLNYSYKNHIKTENNGRIVNFPYVGFCNSILSLNEKVNEQNKMDDLILDKMADMGLNDGVDQKITNITYEGDFWNNTLDYDIESLLSDPNTLILSGEYENEDNF